MENESFFDELSQYDVDECGTIRSPGKYEGEPSYVLYFWMSALDGCSDDEYIDGEYGSGRGGMYISVFNINADDIKLFPELSGHNQIQLWEDSQGFVYHSLASTTNVEDYRQ